MNEVADIFTDFKEYHDEFGLCTPDKKTSGNGILYTAEECLAKAKYGALEGAETVRIQRVLESCEYPGRSGLLIRYPTNTSYQEGPDDYVGAGLASYLLGCGLAKRILRYGRANTKFYFIRYIYNNNDPGGPFVLKSWLGRQLQLIAHLKYCAGETPSLLERLVWIVTVRFLTLRSEHQDSWILSHHLAYVAAREGGWLVKKVANWYLKKIEELKGGWQEVRNAQFMGGGIKNHPVVVWNR